MYTYGVTKDEVWTFNSETREWKVSTALVFQGCEMVNQKHFCDSATIAKCPTGDVYFIGGSNDRNLNTCTSYMLKIDPKNNRIVRMKDTPFCQFDLKSAIHREYIYCIGGCKNWFDPNSRPQNARYNTLTDEWEMLPSLDSIYDSYNQQFSLCVLNDKLYLFWIQEVPNYVYAVMDLQKRDKWLAVNLGPNIYC
jgi:hypothetical protein